MAAARKKELRAEHEERKRQWEQQEPEQRERQRLARLEELKAEKLIGDVASRERSKAIRDYVSEVRKLGVGSQEVADWLVWSKAYADQIDPLCRVDEISFDEQKELRGDTQFRC